MPYSRLERLEKRLIKKAAEKAEQERNQAKKRNG